MKPQNQTVLAVIMALIMISGFAGVYYVSAEYEAREYDLAEPVWNSDTDMLFQELDTTASTTGFPQPYGLGSFSATGSDSNNPVSMTGNNATAVYTGNNTWSMGMTGFVGDTTPLTYMWHHYPVVIEGASSFIADKINISFTMAGDTYQHVKILVGANNNPERAGFVGLKYFTLYEADEHTETEFSQSFDLSTFQKMLWYDACNNADEPIIVIYIFGDSADGISSYAMELSIAITGVPTLTWTLQDSINLVLSLSIALNVVGAVYLTDGVDWGKVRNDLAKRRR